MDVKSYLLPKGVSGAAAASQPRTGRKSDDAKDKGLLSTDVSPSASPSSLSPDELREFSKAIAAELSTSGVEVNHWFNGTIGSGGWGPVDSTFAGSVVRLNSIPQGVGWTQRLGDSVRNRRLRFACHYRPFPSAQPVDPSSGDPSTASYSGAVRFAIVLDKMPIIGNPAPVDASSYGANPPTSVAAIWTQPSASPNIAGQLNPGDLQILMRNPQTLSRYEILREHVIMPSGDYKTAAFASTSGAWFVHRVNSHYWEWDIDLHGLVTQWYAEATSGAIFINAIWLVAIADTQSAAVGGANIGWFRYLSDLTFENLP